MTTSSLPLLQLEKFRHPRRSWRMRVTVGALAVCLGLPLSISQAKADPFTTIFAQFNSLFNSVNSYFTSFPNILSQGLSQMFQGVLSPINQTISSSLQPVQNAINSAQGDLLKFRLDLVQNMSASKASTSPFFTNNPALDGAIFATGLDVDWSRAYANFDLGTDGQKKFTDTLNVISSASQNSQTAGSVAQTMDVTQDIQKQVSLQLAQQSFLQAVTASTALKTNQNLQVGNYNLADINETVSGSEQARQSEIGNAAARSNNSHINQFFSKRKKMFTKLSVLAIGTGGTDFGGAALSAAKNTAKSFDSLWAANFSSGGPMWVPLVALGISLAVFSVAFLVYSFLVNSTKGNDIEAWKQLVWPFIVGILLFNNGALAADGIVGIRNFINNTSTDLLEATNNNISLQQAFKSAKDYAITQQQIGALMRQCQSRIGKDQIDCIASASKTAKELLDKQTGGAWATWLKAQVDQAQERVAAIGQTTAEGCQTGGATGCVGGAVVGAFDAVNALASDQFTQYVMPWLLSAGSAWQAGFELALLLTGLLGALAIGLSTLPVEDNGKPIVIWLGSFFGLFVVKISYNILVGLAATALVTNTGSDPSWFSVFVAFIAPVMSIVAGSFSGVLVFQGLVQLGGAAANSALSLGLRLAK